MVYSIPPFASRDPRSNIALIKEHCCALDDVPAGEAPVSQDWSILVRKEVCVDRQESISLDDEEAERFRFAVQKYQGGKTQSLPEVRLGCFHDATVEGLNFLITTCNNRIIYESALLQRSVLEENGILDRVIRGKATRLPGSYYHLGHPCVHAYYHWMIEVLPRLAVLDKLSGFEALKVLLPQHLTAFQHASLKAVGINPGRFAQIPGGDWRCEKLYFSEIPAPTGSPSPAAVSWLRSVFLNRGNQEVAQLDTRRIYLTRRDAPKRKIINDGEVIAFLERKGFEVVCATELSLEEQIRTFEGAGIIIAPHGAGLTNIMFASPGTIVIELFGDNYVNGCYWALANICSQHHAFLTSPTETLNFHVSIDRLQALLEKVGHQLNTRF
jgi:hypothetical protein